MSNGTTTRSERACDMFTTGTASAVVGFFLGCIAQSLIEVSSSEPNIFTDNKQLSAPIVAFAAAAAGMAFEAGRAAGPRTKPSLGSEALNAIKNTTAWFMECCVSREPVNESLLPHPNAPN